MQNVVGVVGAPTSPWASPAWVPAGVIVALAVGLPLVWLTWRLAFGRLELIYSILEMPLGDQRAKFDHEIRIYDGTSEDPLREPHAPEAATGCQHHAPHLDIGRVMAGPLHEYARRPAWRTSGSAALSTGPEQLCSSA
jgi:hypothetical protein